MCPPKAGSSRDRASRSADRDFRGPGPAPSGPGPTLRAMTLGIVVFGPCSSSGSRSGRGPAAARHRLRRGRRVRALLVIQTNEPFVAFAAFALIALVRARRRLGARDGRAAARALSPGLGRRHGGPTSGGLSTSADELVEPRNRCFAVDRDLLGAGPRAMDAAVSHAERNARGCPRSGSRTRTVERAGRMRLCVRWR